MSIAVCLLFLLTFVKDLDARPEKCASPFVYENAVFFGCTTLGGTDPWCALTPIYQKGLWKYCDDDDIFDERSSKVETKDCGRMGCCSFPFEYRGTLYDECKQTFGMRPWCSLDRIYKGGWKFCKAKDNKMAEDYKREKAAREMQIERGGRKALEQKEKVTETEDQQEEDASIPKEIPTLGGTANGAQCALPFTYYGKTYNNCTTLRSKQPWCSTTEKYAGRWGLCVFITGEQKGKVVYTTGGTAIEGSRCHFPFLYRGRVYTDCTSTLHGTPWCSTDEKYQGYWGECVPDVDNIVDNSMTESSIEAEETSECVIPFIYNGVVYYGCTSLNADYAWCSLTEKYFGQWKMCTGDELKIQQPEPTTELIPTRPDTTIPKTVQPETDPPEGEDEETTTEAPPTDHLLASVPVKSTKHCKEACKNYQGDRCDYVNVGPRKRVGGTVMCELWAGRAKKRVGFTMHRVRY
ncbi:ELSPBP1 [Branchiostoma lanceolatum]|uniref:ELSPBP1 protein n=1 Tax=Branchiostoma lanceolatum TaxID=7740 RepID=A0A8J9ZI33_BRALA|nr:ELSPBP1 [Branchiostoma lanceolatum]